MYVVTTVEENLSNVLDFKLACSRLELVGLGDLQVGCEKGGGRI